MVRGKFMLAVLIATAALAAADADVVGPLDPALGVRVVHHDFLHEAAASGRFGVVETVDQDENGRERVYQWRRLDDYAACEQAASADPRGLSNPTFNERALVQGVCVVRREAEAPTARYRVASALGRDGTVTVVEDVVTGARVFEHGTYGDENALRRLFGLSRTLWSGWSEVGSTREPEAINDRVLTRALKSPAAPFRRAALKILRDRHSMTAGGAHVDERPTGPEVGEALADSPELFAAEWHVRVEALLAAAAVPDARDVLLPVVLQAAAAPLGPDLMLAPVLARRPELRVLTADDDAPGYDSPFIAMAVGAAVARFGGDAPDRLADLLGDALPLVVRRSGLTPSNIGLWRAVAMSKAGPSVARTLLEHGSAPPVAVTAACGIADLLPTPDPALTQLVETRCQNGGWLRVGRGASDPHKRIPL